jgi:hypothetical protein
MVYYRFTTGAKEEFLSKQITNLIAAMASPGAWIMLQRFCQSFVFYCKIRENIS